jgi:hypothetical protein
MSARPGYGLVVIAAYGMPRATISTGLVDRLLPMECIEPARVELTAGNDAFREPSQEGVP